MVSSYSSLTRAQLCEAVSRLMRGVGSPVGGTVGNADAGTVVLDEV
jgi:hypothetical protein